MLGWTKRRWADNDVEHEDGDDHHGHEQDGDDHHALEVDHDDSGSGIRQGCGECCWS